MLSIKSFTVWTVAVSVCLAGWIGQATHVRAQKVDPPKDLIEVRMVGTLNAQVFAIGGETTGVTLSTQEITWELDFQDKSKLRKLAEQLHGTKVRVLGKLVVKKGVEVKQRWIVEVESLQPAIFQEGEGSYLDDQGRLLHALVLTDSQTGFAGTSGIRLTLEPEGGWKLQTFLNDELRPAEQTGRLTEDELRQLAAVMASMKFNRLGERMGKSPQVNPHELSMQWGERVKTLTLRGGEVPPTIQDGVEVTPEMRFGAVLSELRKLCQPR